MPVITFKYQDLKDLGIDMEKDELINTLPMMASDIEDYDDEEIKVEFFPNRPDNLSVEGVARSFKGFYFNFFIIIIFNITCHHR